VSAEPTATAAATPPARERLRQWLASGILPTPSDAADAEALAHAAREQRLVALLHAAIEASSAPASARWPELLRAGLGDEARRHLVQAVAQLDLSARVVALLAARGLRALPLKGAAVAESLYDSPADRPMGDVDVLALDDWAASVRALEEAGFACGERVAHAWSFVEPLTRGTVELHRSLTSCPGLFAMDAAALWSRSRPVSGQVPRVPSAEDLLVHLALHAIFQHGGVLTLGQWLDFRRLLERSAPDPARVAAIARAAGASGCVGAALAIAAVVAGAALTARMTTDMPRGVARWVETIRRDPGRAMVPARPALARVRWAVARGRRWTLVADTLRPPPAESGGSGAGAGSSIARRAAGLVWRYARRP